MLLSFNTSLKITTAKYFTPSGRCIQRIDYSKDNDVIPVSDSIKKDIFSTDNKRIVFSAGGITPDTIVKNVSESDLLKDLLAKGMIFNFADYYYYNNEKSDFSKLNDDKIMAEFKHYLINSKYQYESDLGKKIAEVIKHLKDNYNSEKMKNTLEKLKIEINEMFEIEFKENIDEILKSLKVELAIRYNGTDGGMKEKLKHDEQFTTALNILLNDAVYSKLLNNKIKN